MPGTDFGCSFGTPIGCGDNGVVTRVITSTASASGRQVYVRFDDGREAAYIHLSKTIYVRPQQRVSRGQTLALSGASGFGKEYGYDPHVHVTLWVGVAWNSRFLDFEQYMDGSGGSGGGGGGWVPPIDYGLLRRQKEDNMFVRGASNPFVIYATYTDAKGRPRMRLCGPNEAACAVAGNLAITADDTTLTNLGIEGRYGLPDDSVKEAVWYDTLVQRKNDEGVVYTVETLQELADAKSNTIALLAEPGATVDTKALAADLVAAGVSGATPEQVDAIMSDYIGGLVLKSVRD